MLYNQPSVDSVKSVSLLRDFAYLVALMFVYQCEYSYCGLKPVVANLTILSEFFIYQLMHKRVALKLLKFTLKQLRNVSV
jgi:hypothetical protein